MADNPGQEMSNESLRAAISESVEEGMEIRDRVRDLTLQAIRSRRLDPEEVRQIMRAATEGITLGAEKRGADIRAVMADAVKGLDEAFMKSVEAGRLALEELTSRTRDFSENELKQALANMKKMEEDFLATLHQVAQTARPAVRTEMDDLLNRMSRSGTDTGMKVASTMSEFAHRLAQAHIESRVAGMEAAQELSLRWAQMTSGFLAGLAEALRRDDTRE